MAGRPSDYSEGLAAEICSRLADGRSLRSICRDDDMPHMSTVFLWLGKYPEFSEQYARARETQADALFDEALDIADTPQLGVKTVTKPGGVVEKTEGDMIEHRRLQIETRKWIAGKLRPKKYGDRTQLEHTGRDGGPIQYQDLSKLSDEELDQLERLSAKISSAGGGQGGES